MNGDFEKITNEIEELKQRVASLEKQSQNGLVLNKFTSRKFLLCLLSLATGIVLVSIGKISDNVFATILLGTVGAYITGNVVQKTFGR